MKRSDKTLISASALALAAVLAGCGMIESPVSGTSSSSSGKETVSVTSSETETSIELLSASVSESDYDEAGSDMITLSDSSGKITISEKGTYIITGSSSDGMIVIDVPKDDDVHLVLRDASLTCSSSAAVFVLSADEVYITLEGTSSLANGGTFEAVGDDDVDAVIFSKDNLVFDGDGTLIINSPAGHGIVSKDDLAIAGGTYEITASEDGINSNDSLLITDGTITVNAGDDAIHTDGILQIDGGTIDTNAAEGLEATYIVINDGSITIEASDDGINAAQKSEEYTPTVEINGGSITITMARGDTDGIDSNGDLFINGGTINITGQSTCDYDGTAEFNGGTLIINGEQVNTIPNQMMGGPGMGGMWPVMDEGFDGGMGNMGSRGGMGPH